MSASASLGIGHAKDVVGLDTTVNTAVSWNGSTQLRGNVARNLNTVENAESVFISLLFLAFLCGGCAQSLWLCALESFLLDDIVSLLKVNTVELIDSIGRNGLKIGIRTIFQKTRMCNG